MTRGALVTAALALLLGSSADGLRVSLHDSASAYLAHIAAIAPIVGRDTAFDYYQRLNDDGDLFDVPAPQGYTAAQWSQMIRQNASLDLSLVTQLLQGEYRPMASIRGLGETLVRSSRDGTLQPVAVYVPSSYVPGRPTTLAIMLHGNPQAETALLAPPYIDELAEKTGTILVAPWGRGYYDFRGSTAEVYDALDAATRAFTIDPRRRFLVGYSMGGFSVFEVAPVRPNAWSAVMCIAGGLLGSDSRRVVTLLSGTPFYVLTGTADDSIPTQYPSTTALYLRSEGFEVSFYSQPGGSHRLVTILPILTLAWNDMLHQIVRTPPEGFGAINLPAAIPFTDVKP